VLPAWATVVIALGGTFVGAASGVLGSWMALRVARLNIGHEAQEAWKSRVVDAAQSFLTADTLLFQQLDLAIRALKAEAPDVANWSKKAEQGFLECTPRALILGLLIPPDSSAYTALQNTVESLGSCVRTLTHPDPPPEQEPGESDKNARIRMANEYLWKANLAQDEFSRSANEFIRPNRSIRRADRRRRATIL
jgi:hypothetical protein